MISLFELFKIGIGPSSSHTVGPMLAASQFVEKLDNELKSDSVHRIQVELFGSLALTGVGHATDRAVILGLEGAHPRTVDPDCIEPRYQAIATSKLLNWHGKHPIAFSMSSDLLWHRNEVLPRHPNGIRFSAFGEAGNLLLQRHYYSIGGGFVVCDEDASASNDAETNQPYPFTSAEELLNICRLENLSMADVVYRNEQARMTSDEVDANIDLIWQTMNDCIERGCQHEGILPGGLKIARRAPALFKKLTTAANVDSPIDPLMQMDWVAMFALAVNERKCGRWASRDRATNGAAGVIPAVLAYYVRFMPGADQAGVRQFLLTSGAVGMLYKRNASLSAAEMGCQEKSV